MLYGAQVYNERAMSKESINSLRAEEDLEELSHPHKNKSDLLQQMQFPFDLSKTFEKENITFISLSDLPDTDKKRSDG